MMSLSQELQDTKKRASTGKKLKRKDCKKKNDIAIPFPLYKMATILGEETQKRHDSERICPQHPQCLFFS
jgi:hypothetical protein